MGDGDIAERTLPDFEVKEYPNCFGCGSSNAIGLRLDLRREDDYLVTEFTPREEHQGWPGMVHGGIITSLLYEVLENLPYYRGAICMMKSMETRFRRPARIGKRIYAKSWVVSQSRRDMHISATLESDRGELIAEARAVLVELREDRKARLGLD